MNPREIYQAYVNERRHQASSGMTLEVLPHLCRYNPTDPQGEGFVQFATLAPEAAEAAIDEQIAYFDQRRQAFEWKVYEFDSPTDLKSRLEARGFSCDDEEAFLCLTLADWTDRHITAAAEVRIEKIIDECRLDDVVTVQKAVWSSCDESRRARLWHGIKSGEKSVYCAYLEDRPVGTGWLDLIPGTSFADLHGGAVIAEARGRGVFSALLYQRIREAKAHGYTYVAIDAAPMSRPIVLKKGFQHVCMTYPLQRAAAI